MLTALLSTAPAGQPSRGEDAVRIERVEGPGYVSLFVENRRAYDVTVLLTITARNTNVVRIVPETGVYAGYSRTEAVRVSVPDPAQRWNWRYRFRWTKGSIDARHDGNALYRLPFEKGKAYRVCQGYDGRLSHHGPNQYAVDFAMPEGTTVCAARAGLVVDLKESSNVGGHENKYTNESNYVSIAHADGTIGEYHHLKTDGVLVEIGQRVVAGQAIALSGNTGYSTFPHLHFGVYSAASAEHMQSHPITFTTAQGIIAEPRAGRIYVAE
ncbi:MAG: M23 family metallopeptidase [Phycisphaerales bacterium]